MSNVSDLISCNTYQEFETHPLGKDFATLLKNANIPRNVKKIEFKYTIATCYFTYENINIICNIHTTTSFRFEINFSIERDKLFSIILNDIESLNHYLNYDILNLKYNFKQLYNIFKNRNTNVDSLINNSKLHYLEINPNDTTFSYSDSLIYFNTDDENDTFLYHNKIANINIIKKMYDFSSFIKSYYYE